MESVNQRDKLLKWWRWRFGRAVSCFEIQNQAPYGPAWTSFFSGQKKCAQGSIGTYAGYGANTCATINSNGSVSFTTEPRWGGTVMENIGAAEAPHELASVGIAAQTWCWTSFGGGQMAIGGVSARPVVTNNTTLTGARPQDWVVSVSPPQCPTPGSTH